MINQLSVKLITAGVSHTQQLLLKCGQTASLSFNQKGEFSFLTEQRKRWST